MNPRDPHHRKPNAHVLQDSGLSTHDFVPETDDVAVARPLVALRGRGAAHNPVNRFVQIDFVPDGDFLDADEDDAPGPRTVFLRDATKSILSRNDSPDVGFDVSVNPYRGCEHGCIYCFARPTHEYLGFSAGLDFETKILVKEDAPELLRQALASPKWAPQPIAMSGVTDCYQPAERKLRITRRCLEVLADFRNPVAIVTKNHLVTRDADVLAGMAAYGAAAVNVSVTSLDEKLQRVLEPRTSTPKRRLAAIETLAKAGVPVRVLVAPVIPGLTDHEVPAILQAVADAGASGAHYIPLRLPFALKELFESWLETHFPDRKEKVLGRIREIRGGKLNDASFGSRMRGEGVYADSLRALFHAARRKAGLDGEHAPLSTEHFRRPHDTKGQLGLF
ncbi:MAG TPA: PA0069 family radical SAM protein [Longimicrobium sp.]|nr:PA0069 family radical SAM protein [Longimicrobium sp.]